MKLGFLIIALLMVFGLPAAAQESTPEPIDATHFELMSLIPPDELVPEVSYALFDPAGRLFLVTRTGQIWIVEDGHRLEAPFLDVSALLDPRVEQRETEIGLHGMVFDPAYTENGMFYITYEYRGPRVILARYRVSADDPNVADPDSEDILMLVEKQFLYHTMAQLMFGPDGYLYIGVGDWGADVFGTHDPFWTGQRTDEIFASILRIDVHSDEGPFGIPPDNPFAGMFGHAEAVWVYGLRNPSRFSFDRETGDIYIGDVGTDQFEEINIVPAGSSGLNFGWSYFEGFNPAPQQGSSPLKAPIHRLPPNNVAVVWPALVYGRQNMEGCAITGGYVYRGEALPELQGMYLYADFCSGRVWIASLNDNWTLQDRGELFDTDFNFVAFMQDADGELYLVDYTGGQVLKLVRRAE